MKQLNEKMSEEELIIRRFKNYCDETNWPTKSFKEKVNKYLKLIKNGNNQTNKKIYEKS